MKVQQEKSACCVAKVIRFGGKRRQCSRCKKTWRVHTAKRGRKRLRKQPDYLRKVFEHGFSVKNISYRSSLSPSAVSKRFQKNLVAAMKENRTIRIRGKKLILIIDAEWQYFKRELWTLYFVSVKSAGTGSVTILDPILKREKESVAHWEQIIDDLPDGIKKRIIALVSDGIRGIETVAKKKNWILQRCHFHLLKSIQRMRGKRATTNGRKVRGEIYDKTKEALNERSEQKLKKLCRRLKKLSVDPGCPKPMRMNVREFLRRIDHFRSYLAHPKLKLPTTTNVMESINSRVRRKAVTVNTPEAWCRWAIVCVRMKSKFVCK